MRHRQDAFGGRGAAPPRHLSRGERKAPGDGARPRSRSARRGSGRFHHALRWVARRGSLLAQWALVLLALGAAVLATQIAHRSVQTRMGSQVNARYTNAADPLLYDLVLNSHRLSIETCSTCLGSSLLSSVPASSSGRLIKSTAALWMSDMTATVAIAEKRAAVVRASGAQLHPSNYRLGGWDRLRRNAG